MHAVSSWLRWLVPLAAVLVIAAGALVAGNASADEKLPPRSAEQLLVDLQQADVQGFSGTVEQSADLSVPALPGVSEHGSEFSSLISGTHTLRVAYAAPDSSKVALLGDLSESSVIKHGDDVWTWSSKDNEVTHATIDKAADKKAATPKDLPADAPKTPQEAAQRLLTATADTTDVSVATDTKVANRPAYELVLRPKDDRSLISSVRIAVDATEHVALRVQVLAGDQTVASIGFTDVDFTTPPASTFEFTPPAGAKVTQVDRRTTPARAPRTRLTGRPPRRPPTRPSSGRVDQRSGREAARGCGDQGRWIVRSRRAEPWQRRS